MPEQWQEGWRCPKCGQVRGPSLHDPCLENLPGVAYACCGHGSEENIPYIKFENGVLLRFAPICIEYYDPETGTCKKQTKKTLWFDEPWWFDEP